MKNLFYFMMIIALFALIGCDDDAEEKTVDPTAEMILISTQTDQGTMLEIYSANPLSAGYNTLYIKMIDDGEMIDGHVTLTPIMHMEMHDHSAPYENSNEPNEDGLFVCSVVYIMSGVWEHQISYHNHHTDVSGTVTFTTEIAASSNTQRIDVNGTKYFLTLIEPQAPKAGMNDLIVCLHKQESMMAYPAVTDFTLEFMPWMQMSPEFGHSSENNVTPVHLQMGHYQGKVNFSMTGEWQLHFGLKQGDQTIAELAQRFIVDVQ